MRKLRLREAHLLAQVTVKSKKLQVKWECHGRVVWETLQAAMSGKGSSEGSHGPRNRPFLRAVGQACGLGFFSHLPASSQDPLHGP